MANKSKYDETVQPYIAEIQEAVLSGATVKEIAKAFSVGESTMYKYIDEHGELKEAFARGRTGVCIKIKAALLKKARGYEYTEKKTCTKIDKDGNPFTNIEVLEKHCPPDPTAAQMLLRNYDPTWIDNDYTSTNIKRQKMKLEQAAADANSFVDFGDGNA